MGKATEVSYKELQLMAVCSTHRLVADVFLPCATVVNRQATVADVLITVQSVQSSSVAAVLLNHRGFPSIKAKSGAGSHAVPPILLHPASSSQPTEVSTTKNTKVQNKGSSLNHRSKYN